jgi:hypothetical protein
MTKYIMHGYNLSDQYTYYLIDRKNPKEKVNTVTLIFIDHQTNYKEKHLYDIILKINHYLNFRMLFLLQSFSLYLNYLQENLMIQT